MQILFLSRSRLYFEGFKKDNPGDYAYTRAVPFAWKMSFGRCSFAKNIHGSLIAFVSLCKRKILLSIFCFFIFLFLYFVFFSFFSLFNSLIFFVMLFLIVLILKLLELPRDDLFPHF